MKQAKKQKAVLGLAGATLIGSGISALSSILGNVLGNKANDEQLEFQKEMYAQQRKDTIASTNLQNSLTAMNNYQQQANAINPDDYLNSRLKCGGQKKVNGGDEKEKEDVSKQIMHVLNARRAIFKVKSDKKGYSGRVISVPNGLQYYDIRYYPITRNRKEKKNNPRIESPRTQAAAYDEYLQTHPNTKKENVIFVNPKKNRTMDGSIRYGMEVRPRYRVEGLNFYTGSAKYNKHNDFIVDSGLITENKKAAGGDEPQKPQRLTKEQMREKVEQNPFVENTLISPANRSLNEGPTAFIPGIGDALSVAQAVRDVKNKDYVSAAMLPVSILLGNVAAKGVGKVARKYLTKSTKATKTANQKELKRTLAEINVKERKANKFYDKYEFNEAFTEYAENEGKMQAVLEMLDDARANAIEKYYRGPDNISERLRINGLYATLCKKKLW